MASSSARTGAANSNWKGGRTTSCGYVLVHQLGHPRAHAGNYVFEHILVAERALGHGLVEPAVVHHVNEQKADNRNANLVICQDHGYHKALHARLRIQKAGGNPWTEKVCNACRLVRPRTAFYRNKRLGDGLSPACRECTLSAVNARYRAMRRVA